MGAMPTISEGSEMPRSDHAKPEQQSRAGRPLRRAGLTALGVIAAGSVTVSLAGLALAAGSTTLSSAKDNKGKTVVVGANGHTVYVLTPETSSHLICTSSGCLAAWPPVTGKLKAGKGVTGRLGTLRRSNGQLQLTLNNHPLYFFSGDNAKGDANGDKIAFPGGAVWHVVPAKPSKAGTPHHQSTPSQPAPTSGTGHYGY
jgi:predicted lipoprotein with Yx(FWY)xxD motif